MTNNLFYNFNDYGEYNVEYSLYGTPSFDGCVTLKRVSLPVGTTAIYENMFSYCEQLEEVDIPNGVKRIESAFQNTKISELVLPPTISYVDCQGLDNLPSLERIVCKAKRPPEFNNSYEMSNVELCVPYDMIDLYKEELEGTFASITPIIYGIEEVGEVTVLTEVVDKYTSYVKVKFDMVATIEEGHEPTEIHDVVKDVYIGANNTGNTRIIESVEIYGFEKEVYIEQSAEILNRNKLILYTSEDGEIVEPDDVYSFADAVIVDNVYEDNQGVIIFDRNITSIGEGAFSDCSSLTSIYIPDSVTFIGGYAFAGCSSLANITVGENNQKYDSRNDCNAIVETATNTLIAGCKNTVIPDSVNSIGEGAFSECSSLASIEIPDSVTSIGEWAFAGCSSLASIEIPDSVDSIGEWAFSECSSLTGIEIPDSVTSIGYNALYNCSSLNNITCYAMTAPTIQSSTLYGVKSNGVLYVVPGTNYNTWMSTSSYYLGYYNWYKSDIDITVNSLTNQRPVHTVYANTTNVKIVFDANITVNGKTKDITASTNITIEPNTTGSDRTLTENFTYNGGTYSVTFVQKGIKGVLENQIWYTSTNGATVTPYSTSAFGGATIVSNTYDDGQGIIEFDRDLNSIGSQAFYGRSSLTGIEIPDSVTSIGESAFYNCSSLESIEIGNGVTSIGYYAFQNCSSLNNITCYAMTAPTIQSYTFQNVKSNGVLYVVPGTNYDTWMSTSYYYLGLYNWYKSDIDITVNSLTNQHPASTVYANTTNVKIVFDANITIDDQAKDITGIANITIEPNTTGSDRTLTENFTYNGDTYSVTFTQLGEEGVPKNQIYYTSTDGAKVTPYSTSAFGGATIVSNTYVGGQGIIEFDRELTSIGSQAFSGCSSLTGIEIPDSVTSIGYEAFYGCSSLESIVIGNGVTSIESSAFSGCSSLESIEIPDSVTSIGSSAFSSCSKLGSIVVSEGNTKYDSRDNCNAIIETATNTLIVGCKNTVISDSVTSIGDNAFYYCSSLASIEIGNGVTSIGDYAFQSCYSLASIEIPDSVTSIGYDAFYACSSLTDIEIPDSVTSIGNNAFYGCSSLASIEIPDSVTSIGGSAFHSCSSLANVKLGNGLKYIPYSCFYECPLSNITIPEGVLWIESQAFYNCSELSYVELPSTLMEIDDGAFYDCYSLCTIVSHAEEAPYFNYGDNSRVFDSIIPYGKLFVPDNSDYSPWMTNRELGYYKWSVEPISEIQPTNEIWYTTHDGEIFEFVEIPEMTYGGPEIISNTYENGKGVMKFAEPIEWIGFSPIYNDEDEIDHYEYSFHAEEFDGGPATNLKTVSLPEGVQYAGTFIDDDFTVGAFYGNMSIEEITIPSTFKYADDYTFYDMPNLIKIVNKSPYISYSNNPIDSIPENGTIYVQYNPYNGIDIINGFTYYVPRWTPKWVNEDCTVDIYDYFENGGGGGGEEQ